MRESFKKYKSKIINYRPHKNVSNEKNQEALINNLSKENFINNDKDNDNNDNDNGFQGFCRISLEALNKRAPRKKMLEVIKCLSLLKICRKQ